MNYFHCKQSFELESGQIFPEITIAYHTFGKLNDTKDNVIWICHALTANSDASDWWPGLVGENHVLDPEKYFIVCANILGSCYGSTGPLSIDSRTQQPYYGNFPLITIRDIVKAHQLLCKHLQIQKIHLLAGGSMGGYQVLEWCIMDSTLIDQLFVINTSARESAWGIAIHTAQRLAIEADSSWKQPSENAGQKGLKAARAIGMITYRSYKTYLITQTDPDFDKLDHFKASSYIEYQGTKLVKRFNAYSYWLLTKAMDSHNVARGRSDTIEAVVNNITQRSLVIGIKSDMLCPLPEQEFLSKHLPDVVFVEIDSLYGHDGFLVETQQISRHLSTWLNKKK